MNKLFLVAIIFIIMGCSGKENIVYKSIDLPQSEDLKFTLLSDELHIGGCADIEVYKDHVVVLAPQGNKMLHIFDINSGECVFSGFQMGKGHNEILLVREFSLNKSTGDLKILDVMQNKVYNINIDSVLQNRDGISKLDILGLNRGVKSIYPIADNSWLVYETTGHMSKNPKTRFCKIENGQVDCRYDKYPLTDSVDFYHVYQYQKVVISDNRNKMAVGTMYGAILEIFDISKGIENEKTSYFIKPEYSGNGSILPNENTIMGFIDMYASDNLIYTSYSGSPATPENYKNIVVFDWSGEPVRNMKTNYHVVNLCVDSSEKRIYAMLYDSEMKKFNVGFADIL